MKKFNLLLILYIFSISTLLAQDGYKGGFIIDHNDQYIYGYVRLNPLTYFNVCEFKESLDDESKTFTPEEIKGYGFIPGDSYISFKTDKNDWRFLLLVKKDKITLFRSGEDLFIQKDDDSIQALPSNDNNQLNNILSSAVADCPYLEKRTKSIDATERDILQLIEKYSKCLELGSDTYKGNSQFAAMAGINPSGLSFNPEQYQVSYLAGDKFNSIKAIAAGAIFSHKFQSFEKPKLSVGGYLGLMYINNTYQRIFSARDPVNLGVTYQSDIEIYNQGITLPIGVQLTYESKLQPYLKVGTIIQTWSKTSSSGSLYTVIGSDIYYDEPYAITEIRSEPKFQFAVGLSTSAFKNKRLLFELNAANGKAISTVGPFSVESEIQQVQFLIGLIF